MAWLFGKRHSRLFYSKVKVNPANLSGVGGFGADADLFIDGHIIDIKTVQRPVLQPAWLYQVLGYALLSSRSSLVITGVGFYLARQGTFVQWPLDSLCPRLGYAPELDLEKLHREFNDLLLHKLDCRGGPKP